MLSTPSEFAIQSTIDVFNEQTRDLPRDQIYDIKDYDSVSSHITREVPLESIRTNSPPPSPSQSKVSAKDLCSAICGCLWVYKARRLARAATIEKYTNKASVVTRPRPPVRLIRHMVDEHRKYAEEPITATSPLFTVGNGVGTCDLPPQFAYFFQFSHLSATRNLLCLDLDETLVCSKQRTAQTRENEDFYVVVEQRGKRYEFSVVKRPGLDVFLVSLAELYDLAIFTYAIKEYGDKIVNIIDPNRLIKYRMYRQHCVKYLVDKRHVIVKDLSRVGKPHSSILLIDNSASTGIWQRNNFLLVPSFYGDEQDRVLYELKELLEGISKCKDFYTEIQSLRSVM
ncbi:Nuclear LIM interactor-interacting factor 1 [Giardia lamblia P15]|uniref:Nuclear LIM interactor-interacting factor 1 n=1 Tax=Giardia intestinalis (strain P15) TaxID=658858 RepID=E1F467_GIAIA|nr:Nuclear LIM interactor-interacting factor 1 [Giardia lamblia P15]